MSCLSLRVSPATDRRPVQGAGYGSWNSNIPKDKQKRMTDMMKLGFCYT